MLGDSKHILFEVDNQYLSQDKNTCLVLCNLNLPSGIISINQNQ